MSRPRSSGKSWKPLSLSLPMAQKEMRTGGSQEGGELSQEFIFSLSHLHAARPYGYILFQFPEVQGHHSGLSTNFFQSFSSWKLLCLELVQGPGIRKALTLVLLTPFLHHPLFSRTR